MSPIKPAPRVLSTDMMALQKEGEGAEEKGTSKCEREWKYCTLSAPFSRSVLHFDSKYRGPGSNPTDPEPITE